MDSVRPITLYTMQELTVELSTFAQHGVTALIAYLQAQEVPFRTVLLLACFTFLLGVVLKYFLRYNPNRRMNLPPGPRPWPLIGNLLMFIDFKKSSFFNGIFANSILMILADLASEYGPIFTVWIGSRPTIVFAGVKLTRDALVRKAGVFSGRPKKYSWQFFTNGQRTLLTSQDGPYWLTLRKLFAKRILSPEVVQKYAEVRMSEIERATEAVRNANTKSEGVGFDPEPIIRAQMCNIIMRMNFGDEFDAEGQEIPMGPGGSLIRRSVYMESLCERYRTITTGSIAHMVDYIPSMRYLPSSKTVYSNYVSLEEEVKEWLLSIVKARRQEIEAHGYKPDPLSRENFLDVLLSEQGDEGFSDIEVIWILVEIVMGATDTTTGTLQWSLAYCLAYPEAQTKLFEEIVRVVGYERSVVESDLPNLHYLQAFVKEVMRMKPVVALGAPHSTNQDCKIAGYDIPAKTDVMIHVEKLGNDESIWDSPSEFIPERFLNLTDFQKQSWIPFGLGKRICPGMHMGLLQVQLTLGNLVKTFEWIPGPASGGAIDFSERLHFIIIPNTDICASVRERRIPQL